ncbi:MAG: RNA methyltransferase [Acidobacteriota bacterium]
MRSSVRARLSVVLVGARNPFNIGAAARAMQDFGFSDLRVVNDFAAPFEAAQLEAAQREAAQAELPAFADASVPNPAAVAAQQVLRSARRYDTLLEAIADCTFTVGTTAIGERRLRQPILRLQQAAPLILAALNAASPGDAADEGCAEPTGLEREPPAAEPRVALLFGSEKTGLTNDQLSHCDLLTTIPMFQPEGNRHLSMNLGQSVAVCLYELMRSGFESSVEVPQQQEAPATVKDRERLTQLLLQVLQATGYARRFPANSREPVVRQLVVQLAAASAQAATSYRPGMTHLQAMTVMGILRRVLRQTAGAPEEPEEESAAGSIE